MQSSVAVTYKAYDTLCSVVQGCEKCARMNGSARVLNRAAGRIDAPIMFIGEAPGRLGADSSEIPFHGDKAGHNFEELLEFAGLTRASAFVTNAVLCNPKDEKGNNAPPNQSEIENCSGYLRQQIDLISPKIVVTLGGCALRAVSLVESHKLSLSGAVRTANRWYGRILIPLYHPGQRAMIHRSFANQRSDYQFVAEQLKRGGAVIRMNHGKTKTDVAIVANAIIGASLGISYFALHKLFYLIELAHVKQHGQQLTRAFFIRQKDGPYCVDLHPHKLRKALPHVEFKMKRGQFLVRSSQPDLFGISQESDEGLSKKVWEEILQTLSKYRGLRDSELKTKVYLTTPMRRILREERSGKVNLYNSPIDLLAK
jgi:uracil-DNA glycosylase family 4